MTSSWPDSIDEILAGGFKAPANKTLLALANGYLAKRGYRKARRGGGLVA